MILGAQTAGALALDAFASNDVVVYCFLDDDDALRGQEVHGVSVMGATDDEQFLKLLGKQCEVFVAAEDVASRRTLVKLLKDTYKLAPVNAIHRTATVSEYAWLGHGNLVGAGVVLGPGAHVSNHCQLGARVVVEPGAKLDDFVTVGAGALIGAGATIGEGAFIGAGAVIPGTVHIGKNARVGAGSVVIGPVADKATVFGNPAKAI